MTSQIQFQAPKRWQWIVASGFFLFAAMGCLVVAGPAWAASMSGVGLCLSFVAFGHSLIARASAPPIYISVLLSLFHGAFIGMSLIVGTIFLWPAATQAIPALVKPISVMEANAVVWIPDAWTATPLRSGEVGISIEPAAEDFLTLQEVKVVFKERSTTGQALYRSSEPVSNTFTARKLWLAFHQVSVIGLKGKKRLCSVSASCLSPHLTFTKDLCNAVFKKIEVPATIKQ